MKKELKDFFKLILRLIISIQLVLMPAYAYSADNNTGTPSETNGEKTETDKEPVKELTDPAALKSRHALFDLGEAVEKGNLEEYLKNNPPVGSEKDYFLIANQRAEILEHHINSQNEVVSKVTATVNLNEISPPVPVLFNKLEVKYQPEEKELVIEGLVDDRAQLRHIIPDLDIIDYVHDKEFLIILDRNKGLLLVDVYFEYIYMGQAPIPITRIATRVLETLKTIPEGAKISMEFINRATRPPEELPLGLSNIDKGLTKDYLFEAGDFMLSYTDGQEEEAPKKMLQFIKRSEIRAWANMSYEILDIMMTVVAPQLRGKEGLEAFNKEIEHVVKEAEKASIEETSGPLLDQILSALYTKNSLFKMMQSTEILNHRKGQLQKLSERDRFYYEEWKKNFEEIAPRIHSKITTEFRNEKKKQIEETLSLEQIKNRGKVLTTQEVHEMFMAEQEKRRNQGQKEKKIRIEVLTSMAASTSKGFASFFIRNPITTGIAGIATAGSLMLPEAFLELANRVLPAFNNMAYAQGFVSYELTTLPNLITMAIFLPLLIVMIAKLSLPVMGVLSKILPKNLPFGRKDQEGNRKLIHPQGAAKDAFYKWQKTTYAQKIVAFGMKLAAYGIYPFWNYLAQMVGQPQFFAALRKGLNPLKKITPESDIGRATGITQTTRVGVHSSPQWGAKTAESKEMRRLQIFSQTKMQREESVAWLMASLAVAEKTNIDPTEILLYGVFTHKQDLQKVHENEDSRMDMLWVMQNLKKEIHQLGEMDITKELNELSPEMLSQYYQRALEMAKEVKQQPAFRKKFRRLMSSNIWLVRKARENLNLKTFAGLNHAQHNLLKSIPTSFCNRKSNA